MQAFAHCMVDGDLESLRRDRKTRRIGLAVSLSFQIALLAALVLIPLMTQAVMPLINLNRVPLLQAPAPIRVVTGSDVRLRLIGYPLPSPPIPASKPSAQHHQAFSIISDPAIDIGFGAVSNSADTFERLGISSEPKRPEPPATHGSARPMSVGGTVMEAMLVNRVEPRYPTIARVTHASGAVVLNAIIATDGTIQSLKVLSGNSLLIKAATDAVSQWRYKPTMLDGHPVEVETLITVNFTLQ